MPNQFYDAMPRSPATEIDGNIDAFQDTIQVVNGAALPDGPNLATIGIGAQSETIRYMRRDGDILEEVTRGFSPDLSNRAWDHGTVIARVMCDVDLRAVQTRVVGAEGNIGALQTLTTNQGNDISALQVSLGDLIDELNVIMEWGPA